MGNNSCSTIRDDTAEQLPARSQVSGEEVTDSSAPPIEAPSPQTSDSMATPTGISVPYQSTQRLRRHHALHVTQLHLPLPYGAPSYEIQPRLDS